MTARRIVAAAAAIVLVCLLGAPGARAASAPRCPASVTAPSAIVVEASTMAVACAKHPDQRRQIASTTKLMTALITLQKAKLSDRFRTSSYRPAPAESVIGLLPGEHMTVRDLLRGLLVYSGNDAAMALAVGVAGSERRFVRMMNRHARRLGLHDTHYENPIGLDDPRNYSTAHDLVRLARVLRRNRLFRRITDTRTVTLHSGDHPRTFDNRNGLVQDYDWVNGVKTGHTSQAGNVLVASGRQHGVQVISAVLGAKDEADRDAESYALLQTGLGAFQYISAVKYGAHVEGLHEVPIRYRTGAGIGLMAGRTVRTIVPRGRRDLVSVRPLKVPSIVEGPIARGQKLGTAEVVRDGERIATIPLVSADTIPAATFAQRAKTWFTRPLAVVLAFLVLGGTVLLARRWGSRSRRRPREEATAA